MPSQLSKYLIDASCREYAHPWTESCVNTTAGLGLNVLQESFRIYSTVYAITLLMRGRIPSKGDVKKTVLGVLQSTAFLSWSAFSYSIFICTLRRVLGKFHILTVSFLPSFLSSLSAILIERPSRRTLLCLYVSNIATETLFKMGMARGYYSPILKGETYIFAASMAFLLYFFRSKMNKQDSVYKILGAIVGKYEDAEYLNENSQQSETLTCSVDESSKRDSNVNKKSHKKNVNVFMKSLETYKAIIEWLKAQGKHICCAHPHSCVHYTLSAGLKFFSYGLSAQLVLNLVFQMRKILSKPQLMRSVIFRKSNLNLGIFLGGFAGLYRLLSCSLRRLLNKDSSYFAIPVGLISSLTFLYYNNSTIALYFMWKALQLLWNDLVEKKMVPEVKWFVIFLYCFSTAVLFHVAILEPQNLRSSYWKFLCTISGERIAAMSRVPLDQFGLDSSKYLADVLRRTNTTDKRIYTF